MQDLKPNDILIRDGEQIKVVAVYEHWVWGMYVNCNKENIQSIYAITFLIEHGWKKKEAPWVPELEETYYFPLITDISKYDRYYWNNNGNDHQRFSLGLVFRTKEEALAKAEEIIKMIKN